MTQHATFDRKPTETTMKDDHTTIKVTGTDGEVLFDGTDTDLGGLATGAAITLAPVKRSLRSLMGQCQTAIDAQEAFSGAVKAVAKKACIEPSVLASYVRARVKDKLREHERKAEQMTLLLEGFE